MSRRHPRRDDPRVSQSLLRITKSSDLRQAERRDILSLRGLLASVVRVALDMADALLKVGEHVERFGYRPTISFLAAFLRSELFSLLDEFVPLIGAETAGFAKEKHRANRSGTRIRQHSAQRSC
jgi:hypothetical protein